MYYFDSNTTNNKVTIDGVIVEEKLLGADAEVIDDCTLSGNTLNVLSDAGVNKCGTVENFQEVNFTIPSNYKSMDSYILIATDDDATVDLTKTKVNVNAENYGEYVEGNDDELTLVVCGRGVSFNADTLYINDQKTTLVSSEGDTDYYGITLDNGTIVAYEKPSYGDETLDFKKLGKAAVPEITKQPVSQSVTPGSTATFTVEAQISDQSQLYYEWEKWDVTSDAWTSLCDRSRENFYTVESVTEGMNGDKYRCKVYGGSPEEVTVTSTEAILTVGDQPFDPVPSEPDPSFYTITASATEGGTISPYGAVKVEKGKSQSFTATANDGYTFEKFVIDTTEEVKGSNTYTFDNVNETYLIRAVFVKNDTPEPEPTPIKVGWIKENGQWFYYDRQTGVMRKGWAFVDDGLGDCSNMQWYYLDPVTGAMHTDWQKIDGKWYYLDYNCNNWGGAMITGWHNNIPGWEGKWFYFDRQTGDMRTDWAFVDDGLGDCSNVQWYYLDPVTGVMHTDWQKIDGKWYYFDYSRNNWGGAMVTGWQYIGWSQGADWFDFKASGEMYANTVTPDGYTVDCNGIWVK